MTPSPGRKSRRGVPQRKRISKPPPVAAKPAVEEETTESEFEPDGRDTPIEVAATIVEEADAKPAASPTPKAGATTTPTRTSPRFRRTPEASQLGKRGRDDSDSESSDMGAKQPRRSPGKRSPDKSSPENMMALRVRQMTTDVVFRTNKFFATREALDRVMIKVMDHFHVGQAERLTWKLTYDADVRRALNNKRNSVAQALKPAFKGT